MRGAGEDLTWVDESEDDDFGPSAVHGVALKYYRQWREGRLDPSEPVRTELLLTAEHLLSDMQRRAAAVLMPQAAVVKLALPGMHAEVACEAAGVAIASDTDDPELS